MTDNISNLNPTRAFPPGAMKCISKEESENGNVNITYELEDGSYFSMPMPSSVADKVHVGKKYGFSREE